MPPRKQKQKKRKRAADDDDDDDDDDIGDKPQQQEAAPSPPQQQPKAKYRQTRLVHDIERKLVVGNDEVCEEQKRAALQRGTRARFIRWSIQTARENTPIQAHALFGRPLTMSDLRLYQQEYTQNPKRCWSSNVKSLRCEEDDTETDSVLWKTSKAVADAIADRETKSFLDICTRVRHGLIDIKNIDCFLPVARVEDAFMISGCADCGFGRGDTNRWKTTLSDKQRRKLSILRLWLGASAGTNFKAAIQDDRLGGDGYPPQRVGDRPRALAMFFREILLPTGFATRYNEPFNCSGQRAMDFALQMFRGHAAGPALIMAALMPSDACMHVSRSIDEHSLWHIRPLEWYERTFHYTDDAARIEADRASVLIDMRLKQCATARSHALAYNAAVLRELSIVLPCGGSDATLDVEASTVYGWYKHWTVGQLILLFAADRRPL